MVAGENGLVSVASRVGLLGLDARHDNAKGIGHALRLFGRLLQGFLQRLGGRHQTTWLSFFSLCHVAVSVTVSWVANCVATGKA